MSFFAVVAGAVAPALIGGLLGGSQDDPSSSTQKTTDPRLDQDIYNTFIPALRQQFQNNPSGLNDQMRQGLNRQWNVYNDPQNAQGYTNISNLGQSLLSAPVMGNGYGMQGLLAGRQNNSQQVASASPQGQRQQSSQSLLPAYGTSPALGSSGASNTGPFTAAPAPAPVAAPAPAPASTGMTDQDRIQAQMGFYNAGSVDNPWWIPIRQGWQYGAGGDGG